MQSSISYFKSGTHNRVNDELIPSDAASDSLNWLTRFGKLELIPGRQTQGGSGLTGKNYAEHTAYKVDGTSVRYRKVSTKISLSWRLNASTAAPPLFEFALTWQLN